MQSRTTKTTPLQEGRLLVSMALPLAIAQLGQMLMTLSATVILGHLNSAALAAGGLGTSLTALMTLVSQGLLASLQPIIAQARGRNEQLEQTQAKTMKGAFIIAAACSVILVALMLNMTSLLLLCGVDPATAHLTGQFCQAYAWGLPAILFSAVLRYYLAALERPKVVMWIFFIATIVYVPICWLWVLSDHGIGIAGAGYALSVNWWMICLGLLCYVIKRNLLPSKHIVVSYADLKHSIIKLLKIGGPIGGIYAAEMGLISLSSVLIGQFGTAALSSHMICLNVANILFMIPLALSQAASVRVAYHSGRSVMSDCQMSARIAMMGAIGYSAFIGGLLLLGHRWILHFFLQASDPNFQAITQLTSTLFVILALYLLFDNLQVVLVGVLRGLQDTRQPMFYCLFGYWGIAFTVGLSLAYGMGLLTIGLWIGYALGLAVVSGLLFKRWNYNVTSISHASFSNSSL